MSYLSDAKFAASSLLASWKKRETVGREQSIPSVQLSAALQRGEAKRIWSIRKREFDKLRALRQNEIHDSDRPKQRFFHTSMLTDLSETTSTIKKIDEIEAQMSMQWWKTDRLDLNHRVDTRKPE